MLWGLKKTTVQEALLCGFLGGVAIGAGTKSFVNGSVAGIICMIAGPMFLNSKYGPKIDSPKTHSVWPIKRLKEGEKTRIIKEIDGDIGGNDIKLDGCPAKISLISDDNGHLYWRYAETGSEKFSVLYFDPFKSESNKYDLKKCFSFFSLLAPDKLKKLIEKCWKNSSFIHQMMDWRKDPNEEQDPKNCVFSEVTGGQQRDYYLYRTNHGEESLGWKICNANGDRRNYRIRINPISDIDLVDRIDFLADFKVNEVVLGENQRLINVKLDKILHKSHLSNEHLDRDRWSVSLINCQSYYSDNIPTSLGHALLAIETVLKGKYFSFIAHLTAENDGTVELKHVDGLRYTNIAGPYVLSSHDIQKMINEINRDVEFQNMKRPRVKYVLLGDRSLFTPGTKSNNVEHHNCATWAIDRLKYAGVDLSNNKGILSWIGTTPVEITAENSLVQSSRQARKIVQDGTDQLTKVKNTVIRSVRKVYSDIKDGVEFIADPDKYILRRVLGPIFDRRHNYNNRELTNSRSQNLEPGRNTSMVRRLKNSYSYTSIPPRDIPQQVPPDSSTKDNVDDFETVQDEDITTNSPPRINRHITGDLLINIEDDYTGDVMVHKPPLTITNSK